MKVVVGEGGTSWAVNVMEWPFPSSSVRVLSPAMHWWAFKSVGTGAEVERTSSDGRG